MNACKDVCIACPAGRLVHLRAFVPPFPVRSGHGMPVYDASGVALSIEDMRGYERKEQKDDDTGVRLNTEHEV